MEIIELAITTQSPVLLAAGPPARNLTETLDFIPGNTLRGLLAYRYLALNGQATDEVFRRLFLSGEVRFGFALIAGAQPIPLSARSCKYNKGFLENNHHGVVDMLLNASLTQQCDEKRDSVTGEERRWTCRYPQCGKPLDYIEGFMDPTGPIKRMVKKRLMTRTAIDPVRGTAKNGQLYSQRLIEEGQIFCTNVEFPSDLKQVLQRLVQKSFTAHIGTGKSRGQGWVGVKLGAIVSPLWDNAEKRYKQFSIRYGQPVLAVTLQSDSIFVDEYLRDRGAPILADFEPLGITSSDWCDKPVQAYTATRLVFGFDGYPLQLPAVPRLAVCAGSTFLYTSKVDCPIIPEGSGIGWIGDNQRDGYGRVALWHPFHLSPDIENDHG